MYSQHLTDQELQNLLEGHISEAKPEYKNHLESCNRCQKALLEYRQISKLLSKEPDYQLSPDFIQSVLSKLPMGLIPKFLFSIKGKIFIGTGFLVATCVTILLVGIDTILEPIRSFDLNLSIIQSVLISPLKNFFNQININPVLLISAGIALLFTSILDKFLIHRRDGVQSC